MVEEWFCSRTKKATFIFYVQNSLLSGSQTKCLGSLLIDRCGVSSHFFALFYLNEGGLPKEANPPSFFAL